jgi:hypothetical protein
LQIFNKRPQWVTSLVVTLKEIRILVRTIWRFPIFVGLLLVTSTRWNSEQGSKRWRTLLFYYEHAMPLCDGVRCSVGFILEPTVEGISPRIFYSDFSTPEDPGFRSPYRGGNPISSPKILTKTPVTQRKGPVTSTSHNPHQEFLKKFHNTKEIIISKHHS